MRAIRSWVIPWGLLLVISCGRATPATTTVIDGLLDCAPPGATVIGSEEMVEGYAGSPTPEDAARESQTAWGLEAAELATISEKSFVLVHEGREIAKITVREAPAGGWYASTIEVCQADQDL